MTPPRHRRPTPTTARAVLAAALCLAALASPTAAGAAGPDERGMTGRADPWVPPARRVLRTEPPTQGAALQAQVRARLLRRFAEADGPGYGTITRDQAQRSGFGYVSRHFERIDAGRSGSISFEQLMRFVQQREAAR